MIYCPGTLTKWRIYNPPAARGAASRLPSAVSPLRGPPPLQKAALPRSNLLPGQPASQMIHECVRALALIRNNLKIIPAPGLLIGWAEAFVGTTTQPNFSLCLVLLSSLGWSQEHVPINTLAANAHFTVKKQTVLAYQMFGIRHKEITKGWSSSSFQFEKRTAGWENTGKSTIPLQYTKVCGRDTRRVL